MERTDILIGCNIFANQKANQYILCQKLRRYPHQMSRLHSSTVKAGIGALQTSFPKMHSHFEDAICKDTRGKENVSQVLEVE